MSLTTLVTPEKLECKYCRINLADQTFGSVGFVSCPNCNRTYLKLPQSSARSGVSLSSSRKKVLDIFLDPKHHESILDELKANLKLQEENLSDLKNQKENLNLENIKTHKLLQENLAKTQSELEEISIVNQELQISLNEVNFELKRVQDIIAEKNQLIVKLKSDFEVVSEKLRLKENMYEVLEKESSLKSASLANVSNDLHEVKNLCVSYEAKIVSLENDLKNEKENVANLNMTLSVIPDLEVELDKAKGLIQSLQKSIESNEQNSLNEMASDQVAILNEEINALKIDIKDYILTISELQALLESKNNVIKSKETEIYSLSQMNEDDNAKADQLNLFSNIESDEIIKLRDRVRRLEQTEQKLENLETELEISRDELSKAKKEILEMNGLLEKAFYENQKNQVETAPVPVVNQNLVSAARDIEKREDELMEFSYEVNNKIENFVNQFGSYKSLAFDVAVIREDANGRQVFKLFDKEIILPSSNLEVKKVISYNTVLNKGFIYFQQEDNKNIFLNSLKIDFSSNTNFFLSTEEYDALENGEIVVEIREEYSLNAKGELSVSFYRNNGFKRFDAKIGILSTVDLPGLEKYKI